MVKKFRGEVGFSATSATKIYVNLDVECVSSLIERFSGVCNGVQAIESNSANKIPLEEQMFLNRMNINELLKSDWDSNMQEHTVTVRGRITDIDNFYGWCYVSCNICSKKVVPIDSVYICDFCNKECKFPLVKYKIHLKVTDKTGVSTFVLFNMEAEKLLDTSAHKLFNRQAPNSSDIPVQIRSLCGKDFIFKLKLNSYNFKEGPENYCISKLFTPDKKLELEYISQKEEKVGQQERKTDKDVLERDNSLKKETTEEEDEQNCLQDSEGELGLSYTMKHRKRMKKIVDDDETDDDEKMI